MLIDHKEGAQSSDFVIKKTNMHSMVQLESSISHFLALKKKIRPSIVEWDSKTVSIWMGRIGFDQCQKIILYGRVTGEVLANATFEFMHDTLGITDENQCSKLKGELEKVRKSCIEDCALFGWGNNRSGQLATKKANILSAPKKLDVPDHIVLDETKKNLDSITA